jgi:hypothetical protein
VDVDPLAYLTPAGTQQVTEEGHMTDARLSEVEEVRELLQRQGEGNVQRNPELIEAVREVFSPWTQAGGDEFEFQIIKIEDMYYYQCPQCQARFADVASCKKHIKQLGHVRKLKANKKTSTNKKKKTSDAPLPPPPAPPAAAVKIDKTITPSKILRRVPPTPTPTASPSIATVDVDVDINGTGCDENNRDSTSRSTASRGAVTVPVPVPGSSKKARDFVCTVLPLCASSYKKRSFCSAGGLQHHMEVKHPGVTLPAVLTAATSLEQEQLRVRDFESVVEGMAGVCLAERDGVSVAVENISLSCPLCHQKKTKKFGSVVALQDHMLNKHDMSYPDAVAATDSAGLKTADRDHTVMTVDIVDDEGMRGNQEVNEEVTEEVMTGAETETESITPPPPPLPSIGAHLCTHPGCSAQGEGGRGEFLSLSLLNTHMREQHGVVGGV